MEKINQQLLINKNDTIKKAMIKIQANGTRTLVVTNKTRNLFGTLSERRHQDALVKNNSLNDKISKIYNKFPKKILNDKYNLANIKNIFIKNQFGLIPIVTKQNLIEKIVTWNEVFSQKYLSNLSKLNVIIMAGGQGTEA